MEYYKIIYSNFNPEYTGLIGTIENTPKAPDNCMFYPLKGKYPYRICLNRDWVAKVDESEIKDIED